ncbi:pyridoxamine 5'-phosphate oxidase family protein [Fodinibius salsisoli]|uniref:Pyridoxamine 5'-phosphate oxidase family protein n=1 Tax=Fodinibius salsisoli TaxID=2820877 RepID=A0ABT3PMB3_9BACT|nr:pyridoxamine 5'-phosphate oxidase family protein [Fodinibius salsisoli]MCW9707085.1 pyridoxamine 5'-phosphate oxidase family protein [Fodinibius salsisoli]
MRYPKTDKTKISRDAHRGSYDSETIHRILDHSMYCVISFCQENKPFAIPTGHVRLGHQLFVHGSAKSHFLTQLIPEKEVCISASIMDGLVLAKSGLSHSFNYRSVILFANTFVVEEQEKKRKVLKAFTEKLIPGRWEEIRKPTGHELNATKILGFDIKEASAKQRSGPPNDNRADQSLPVWAGVIPLQQQFGPPEEHAPDTDSRPLPSHIKELLDND